MGSQLDDQGFPKQWAGDRQKKPATKYTSLSKQKQMDTSRRLADGGRGRIDPRQKLIEPFRTPSFVNRETQTNPVVFADETHSQMKSKSRTPRSDYMPEDEENQPPQVKAQCPSSDDEDDHLNLNDIPPSIFKNKNEAASTAGRARATLPSKISGRIESSETSASGSEHKPRASKPPMSRVKTERSEKKALKDEPASSGDEPKKVFKSFAVTSWDEPEDTAAEPRKSFKQIRRTASPEPKHEKKKVFMHVKLEELGEDDDEEKKKAFRRAAILKECGGSPTSIKRSLKVAGLGAGLDEIENNDIWRSPPKKVATANQGLSSLAARIAGRRIKEEGVKEEEIDDTQILLDVEQATCPMCHEPVSQTLLMSFSDNRPRSLNTRQQAAFCAHHKRDSALTTYRSLGYPDIPWASFTSRLTPHYAYISSLIKSPSTTPSHYRPLFASDITHGRNRTLKQSIMGTKGDGSSTARVLIPGYYGPRGAQAIQQALLLKFNRELRRAAVEDHVVSARAVGGYVASVLVPELGTRLIMEDMGIGEVEARGMMERSAEIGGLVNEEVKDVRSDADRGVEEGGDYD